MGYERGLTEQGVEKLVGASQAGSSWRPLLAPPLTHLLAPFGKRKLQGERGPNGAGKRKGFASLTSNLQGQNKTWLRPGVGSPKGQALGLLFR